MTFALLSLAALAAGPDPAHFEPSLGRDTEGFSLAVGGQTYYDGRFAISGASAALRVDGPDGWVFGADARMLDDPFASDHWDVHAATAWIGYALIDRSNVRIAPYVRAGSHFQAGLVGRVTVPLDGIDLVIDGSAGPSLRNPWMPLPDRLAGVFAEPGLPEVGVGVESNGSWRPSARLGLVGDQIVLTGGIGSTQGLWLRAALARAPHEARGFALLQAGASL